MEKLFNISDISFNNEFFILKINNQEYKFAIKEISEKLAKANLTERQNFIVSPSGYGIHWPALDEDLSINGLLHYLKSNRHVA
ncbi:MAG: DUF2442 domain-containing protein [Bacteroidetes bacterium]|nr:DUF2442 domain-containing protein [Bacteroidota bacterium]